MDLRLSRRLSHASGAASDLLAPGGRGLLSQEGEQTSEGGWEEKGACRSMMPASAEGHSNLFGSPAACVAAQCLRLKVEVSPSLQCVFFTDSELRTLFHLRAFSACNGTLIAFDIAWLVSSALRGADRHQPGRYSTQLQGSTAPPFQSVAATNPSAKVARNVPHWAFVRPR